MGFAKWKWVGFSPLSSVIAATTRRFAMSRAMKTSRVASASSTLAALTFWISTELYLILPVRKTSYLSGYFIRF